MSHQKLEVCEIEAITRDEERDEDEIASYISLGITSGSTNILKVVEGFECLLNDKDEFKRLHGTNLFASILLKLPGDFLSPEEVKFISTFFCDRINDHFVVTPSVLQGLLAVVGMTNLGNDAPALILKTLSDNVSCQTLQQCFRYTYYSILDTLLHKKTKVLLEKPSEIVQIVIVSMESESDPRNLMKLFRMLPFMFRSFPLKDLAEEAFMVLECYFPVDFYPKDTEDISREDLASGLEDCLTATPEFGPFCLPLLLEKLDSELKVAITDCLKLLIKGCPVWEMEHINKHLTELWNSFKSHLFPGTDADVSELVVKALVEVVVKYSTSPLDKNQADSLNHLLNGITASTHEFLRDPGLSLFMNAAAILGALANTSYLACCHVVFAVVPQFLALLLAPVDHQEIVLSAFQPILRASIIHNVWQTKNEALSKILSNIPKVLVDMKKGKGIAPSFLCFSEILSILSFDCRQTLYGLIVASMPKEKSELARQAYAEFLKKAGTLYPDEVKSHIFSHIPICGINELPPEEIKNRINMFCCACHVRPLTSYAINRIIESISSASYVTPISISCSRSLCEDITDDIVLESLANDIHLPEVLLSFWLKLPEEEKINMCSNGTLVDISLTIDALIKPLNSSHQSKVIESCISSFAFNSSSPPNFSNHLLASPEAVLLEGFLGSLRPEIVIPSCEKLAFYLLHVSLNSNLPIARESAARLLASIINKQKDDPTLKNLLDQIGQVIYNAISTPTAIQSVHLFSWICKGLALRAHSQLNLWVDKLLGLLKVSEIQMEAAKGFQLMMIDNDRFLNCNSHCEIRILYKQRLFQWIDKMIVMFEDEEGDTKSAISMAIAYMLQLAPRQLLFGKLPKLIKVMIICLDGDDLLVSAAILDVLASLLYDKEPVLEDYMDTFIPKFITHCYSSSMKVRMTALDCIFYYANYTPNKISIYLDLVLNSMIRCLDDKKRLVRQKAVRARNKWFLLDFS